MTIFNFSKFKNGLTSSSKVMALKLELRKNKIRSNRLVNITLDFAKMCDNGVVCVPKQLDHIIEVIEYLSKRNIELGLEIQRERQKVSDKLSTYHSKNFRSNDDTKEHLNDFVTSFKKMNNIEDFKTIHLRDSVLLSKGFSTMNISRIADKYDFPVNSSWVYLETDLLHELQEMVNRIKLTGNINLADFIMKEPDSSCAVRVTEDGKFFIIVEAKRDTDIEKSSYMITFKL